MISLSKAHLQKVACLTTATALFSLANPLLADGYHYQIQAATKFLSNPAGELTSLKMDWTYDPDLTAALLEDEDLSEENKAATLKSRANDILEDLNALGYFSQLSVDGQALLFNKVQDYNMTLASDDSMTLSFDLPLKTAVKVNGKKIALRLTDPDGVGTLTYSSPQKVSLDENLTKNCSAPKITEETITLPNDHKPVVPIVQIECK